MNLVSPLRSIFVVYIINTYINNDIWLTGNISLSYPAQCTVGPAASATGLNRPGNLQTAQPERKLHPAANDMGILPAEKRL